MLCILLERGDVGRVRVENVPKVWKRESSLHSLYGARNNFFHASQPPKKQLFHQTHVAAQYNCYYSALDRLYFSRGFLERFIFFTTLFSTSHRAVLTLNLAQIKMRKEPQFSNKHTKESKSVCWLILMKNTRSVVKLAELLLCLIFAPWKLKLLFLEQWFSA